MANAVDCSKILRLPERANWRAVLEDEADYLLTVPVETNWFGLQRGKPTANANYWQRQPAVPRRAVISRPSPRWGLAGTQQPVLPERLSMPADADSAALVDVTAAGSDAGANGILAVCLPIITVLSLDDALSLSRRSFLPRLA